jgi:hydrophobic/amphiphilic exporter-1 (mainly G- bacteria), HAE1 family
MTMIAIIFLGFYGLRQLTIDLLPSFSFPLVFLTVTYPNVAPEEMETLVTRPIEDAASQVPGIQQVTSTSFEGSATVRAQFNFGTNVDTAATDIREQLERIKNRFPNDPNLSPIGIFKADPTQLPVLIVGVNDQSLTPTQLTDLVENTLIPKIEAVSGVAAAVDTGGVVRQILIEVNNERLAALGIPLSTVINRVAQQNENVAGGIGREGSTEYEIRVTGLVTDSKQFNTLVLGTAKDGTPIMLGTVARVLDTGKEQRIIGRLNSVPSVGITISKQSDANTVAVVNALYQRLKGFETTYPGLRFAPIYDQHTYIQDSITALQQNALLGACLAILVILFFLHSIRSTLVIALSIPTSVAGAFLAMYLAGFNLNIMTLGGLALAVGLMVDDAIVVLENIFRRTEAGESQVDAAKSGAAQIYGAVVSSTITVMIVFLPMLLIGGVASKLFQPFALVVVFAVGVSLLVALTVVPMLAARFIHRSDVEESHYDPNANPFARVEEFLFERFGDAYHRLEARYRRILGWALDHGLAVTGIAIGAVVIGLVLIARQGVEILPPSNTNYITVNYQLPTGTALSLNNAFAQKIEAELRADTANVQDVYGNIGTGGNFVGFGTRPINNQGQIFITLRPMGHGSPRTIKTTDYVNMLRQRLNKEPGVLAYPVAVDIVSRILSFATGAAQGIAVQLYGPDVTTLSNLSKAAVDQLRGNVPGLVNVRSSITDSAPQMDVVVDRNRAAQLGIPLSTIADTVATATNGTIASRFESNGEQYDINVMFPQSQRKTTNNVNDIMLITPLGQSVPLAEVANVTFGKGPNQITRQNKERYVEIDGDVIGAPLLSVASQVQQKLASFPLPPAYRWDFTSGTQAQTAAFGSLGVAVLLAIILIYMLLAAKYESFWQPFVIMLTVPLAIAGVGLGLIVFGKAIGLTAMIGVLALIGIVVKNAILVVEFTNQLRAQGQSVRDALLTAGPIRMRPILMTTSATCLGLLPLGLGLQPGSETQSPLAAVVIGGLLTSTLLTLIVVPVAYLNGQRFVHWYMRTGVGRFLADLFGVKTPSNGELEPLDGEPVVLSPDGGATTRHKEPV